jgi:hypothetical protein
MTFTYNVSDGFSDLERVRFHIYDTVEADAKFTDEEITAIITEEGSYQSAVIACLINLKMRINNPMFRADWLTVDPAEAVKAYERMITEKRREFGIAQYSATAKHVYRDDGRESETPDYSADKS